jgi:small subunit ribosomal protein S5
MPSKQPFNRGKGNAPGGPNSPNSSDKSDKQKASDSALQAAMAGAGESTDEWKEKVIQIRRVTKVVKGGKKLSFRAVVVVGNGNGKVGVGIGKSNEVIGAIQKGVSEAKKNLIDVPIFKHTIPHMVQVKVVGAQVLFRPASDGTGVIAGGAARSVLELAGIQNVLSKTRGKSPLNVANASLEALRELRSFKDIADARGLSVKQMLLA